MPDATEVHTIADWVTLWVGQGDGSIMIKTREPHGDPVELAEDDAAALIECLRKMIAQIR